jgi:hypothetical protein
MNDELMVPQGSAPPQSPNNSSDALIPNPPPLPHDMTPLQSNHLQLGSPMQISTSQMPGLQMSSSSSMQMPGPPMPILSNNAMHMPSSPLSFSHHPHFNSVTHTNTQAVHKKMQKKKN